MINLAELNISPGSNIGILSFEGVLRNVQVVKIQSPVKKVDTYQNGLPHEHITPGWIYVSPPPNESNNRLVYYPDTQTFRMFSSHQEYEAGKHYQGELLVGELSFDFQGFQPLS